jgi:hypothetical protein
MTLHKVYKSQGSLLIMGKPKIAKKVDYDESQNDKFIIELVDLNEGLDLKKLDGRE